MKGYRNLDIHFLAENLQIISIKKKFVFTISRRNVIISSLALSSTTQILFRKYENTVKNIITNFGLL